MILKVWKTDTGYFVRIRNSYYEMSADANMPNGVCSYHGKYPNIDERQPGKLICSNARQGAYKTLLAGLRKQINNLS